MEAEGIPTTQISLIREHTEIILPPRALWVPFALGRPLGVPGEPAFQRQVLLAVLELFNFHEGPVLVDFPDNVPEKAGGTENYLDDLACPVSFALSAPGKNETEELLSAFELEVDEFRSWYDMGLEKRGYSSVAYFAPDIAGRLLIDFVRGRALDLSGNEFSPATALRLAAQDLKAFYFEAVMFRPGSALPDEGEFTRWFWRKTAAGNFLRLVREKCLETDDEQLRVTGSMLLVPLDQA